MHGELMDIAGTAVSMTKAIRNRDTDLFIVMAT